MTTRITAKYRADDNTLLRTVNRSIPFDVDDETARLIGLGLLFDADCCPGEATVEIGVDRGQARDGSSAFWRNWKAQRDGEREGPALDAIDHVRRAQEIAGFGLVWTEVTRARNAAIVASAGDRLTAASVAARLAGDRPVMVVGPTALPSFEHMLWAPTPESSRGKRVGCLLVTLGADVTGEEWAKALTATVMSAGPFAIVVAEKADSTEWKVFGSLDELRDCGRGVVEASRKCGALDMALRSVLWLLDDKAEMPVEILDSVEGKVRAYAMAEELLAKHWVRRENDVTNGGPDGAIDDVLAFHNAIAESHPDYITERNGPAALVRATSRYALLKEEFDEYTRAMVAGDLVGVLDALVDMDYVIKGTGLIQFGRERYRKAWAAVHKSNMAKRWPDNTFHVNEAGKVIKPPGWVGPDIAAIVGVAECESTVEASAVHTGDKCLVDGEWRTIRTARTNDDNYREVTFWGSGEIRRWHPGLVIAVKRRVVDQPAA